jgi:hypothetical protein
MRANRSTPTANRRTAQHRTRALTWANTTNGCLTTRVITRHVLLLICGFGVQVPGGAPCLTWAFAALPVFSDALPTSRAADIGRFLPADIGSVIMSAHYHGSDTFGPWTSLSLLAGYATVALAIGALLLLRRRLSRFMVEGGPSFVRTRYTAQARQRPSARHLPVQTVTHLHRRCEPPSTL